jgi:hypothetical protein
MRWNLSTPLSKAHQHLSYIEYVKYPYHNLSALLQLAAGHFVVSYCRLDVDCLDSVELSLHRHSLQAVVAARIIDLVEDGEIWIKVEEGRKLRITLSVMLNCGF